MAESKDQSKGESKGKSGSTASESMVVQSETSAAADSIEVVVEDPQVTKTRTLESPVTEVTEGPPTPYVSDEDLQTRLQHAAVEDSGTEESSTSQDQDQDKGKDK